MRYFRKTKRAYEIGGFISDIFVENIDYKL